MLLTTNCDKFSLVCSAKAAFTATRQDTPEPAAIRYPLRGDWIRTLDTQTTPMPQARARLGTTLRPATSTSVVPPLTPTGRLGLLGTIRAYVMLTKPRIIELLLITTVPAMVLAAKGVPSGWLVLATLFGGALSAAGANVFNSWYDRDIDALMARTQSRPLPQGQVTPRAAITFGIVLELCAMAWLYFAVNPISSLLAACAAAFYALVYTVILKRSSVQNIVIGGAAGAVPALIGWAAVRNGVSIEAWVLFALIFFWTPPHFWALAIKYKDDYERAGVPMLPGVMGLDAAGREIWRYSCIMFSISLLFGAAAHMGIVYLATALILGVVFLRMAWLVKIEPTVKAAMRLFHYSISYLGLIFAGVALDQLLR